MGFLLFFIIFFGGGGGLKNKKTVKETGYGYNLSWKFLISSFHFCCSQVFQWTVNVDRRSKSKNRACNSFHLFTIILC